MFYTEYFDFLFNNTSTCYLLFAFFFPTLLLSFYYCVLMIMAYSSYIVYPLAFTLFRT